MKNRSKRQFLEEKHHHDRQILSKFARVEVPEQISTEQRCFRDFINFGADQRCFRDVQRWFSLNQRCSALDQNEVRNRRKCCV